MFIPFYLFLIVYLIGLAVFFMLAFFNLYHIFRFGFLDRRSIAVTVFFLVAIFVILIISAVFFDCSSPGVATA